MSYSGGTLKEVTCSHPDLGQFLFDPKSGEDSTYELGGPESEDDEQSITASGKFIDKVNITRCSFEGTLAGSPGDGTIENLKALQASLVLGSWTITNINGKVYKLKGKPVGKLSMNGMNSTIALKLQGEGVLQII